MLKTIRYVGKFVFETEIFHFRLTSNIATILNFAAKIGGQYNYFIL